MTTSLESMSVVDLINEWNTSNSAAIFRNELRRRADLAATPFAIFIYNGLKVRLEDQEFHPAPSSAETPSRPSSTAPIVFYAIIDNYRTVPDVRRVAQALLNSGWDRVDPAGRVQKTPAELENFLTELSRGAPQSWSDMHPAIQGFFKMVIDAFYRAYNAQRTNTP